MIRFLVCLDGNYKSKYNLVENDIILLLYNKLINLLGVSTKLCFEKNMITVRLFQVNWSLFRAQLAVHWASIL